jgi:hypothetical protein
MRNLIRNHTQGALLNDRPFISLREAFGPAKALLRALKLKR